MIEIFLFGLYGMLYALSYGNETLKVSLVRVADKIFHTSALRLESIKAMIVVNENLNVKNNTFDVELAEGSRWITGIEGSSFNHMGNKGRRYISIKKKCSKVL